MSLRNAPVWQTVYARHAVGLSLGQLYALTDKKRTVRCVRVPGWNSTLSRRIVHTRDLAQKARSI